MDGFFSRIDKTLPMDRQDDKIDPVFYKDDNPEIYILTTSRDRGQERIFKGMIRKSLKRDVGIEILYAYKMFPSDKDKKAVLSFSNQYTIDLKSYIPRLSRVITIGNAIYSITRSSDLSAEAFYNYRYLDSYFFSPDLSSWVFPVTGTSTFWSYEGNRFLDGFNTMFLEHQITSAVSFIPFRISRPELVTVYLDTREKADSFLRSHVGLKEEVSFDIETTGLLWYNDDIVCITLSFDGITGYYIPWNLIDTSLLNEFFANKYCIGQNIKFDCKFLRYRGVRNVKIDFDTLNASQLINDGGYADTPSGRDLAIHNLGVLGWTYTMYGGHKNEMQEYNRASGNKNFGAVKSDILIKYATEDSIVTYLVYKKLRSIIDSDSGMSRFFYDEEIPNLNMFIGIEMTNLSVDFNDMECMRSEFEDKKRYYHDLVIQEAIKMMVLKDKYLSNKNYVLTDEDKNRYSSYDIDLESMNKLAKAIEHDLGMPCMGRGKDGTYTTADPMLTTWSNLGYDICGLISKYREYSTFLKTFVGMKYDPREKGPTAYWEYKDKKRNALHPTYSVMLADSHRNKCSSPNFQQVPKQGDLAKRFRHVFITPDPNEKIETNDYVELSLEDGRMLSIPYDEKCEVERNGKRQLVLVQDMSSEDIFIGVDTIDN